MRYSDDPMERMRQATEEVLELGWMEVVPGTEDRPRGERELRLTAAGWEVARELRASPPAAAHDSMHQA
jgi:hypothetical protein